MIDGERRRECGTRQDLRRWVRSAVAAAALPLFFVADAAAREPAPKPVGVLTAQTPLFWDGAVDVDSSGAGNGLYEMSGASVETCGNTADPCFAYALDVAEAGRRLRVAIDVNRRGQCHRFELFEPGAYEADGPAQHAIFDCTEIVPKLETWNRELRVASAAVGRWIVRVIPYRLSDWSFRLRAALDTPSPASDSPALPNLIAFPPYEFGFTAPANPAAGHARDNQNPPGPSGISCTPDERAEAAEHGELLMRCLRLSTGIYNTGPGAMEIELVRDEQQSLVTGNAIQRVVDGDGDLVSTRPAGTWTYHAAHAHEHYDGIASFELFRVHRRPRPPHANGNAYGQFETELLGRGRKSGWNGGPQRFVDWRSFAHETTDYASLNRCNAAAEYTCITSDAGLGDHYRWQRPGNYVPFPQDLTAQPTPGLYLVRVRVDSDDNVLETDETDNSAYALIKVQGEDVTICERGYGTTPWADDARPHEESPWVRAPGGTSADGPAKGDCGL